MGSHCLTYFLLLITDIRIYGYCLRDVNSLILYWEFGNKSWVEKMTYSAPLNHVNAQHIHVFSNIQVGTHIGSHYSMFHEMQILC